MNGPKVGDVHTDDDGSWLVVAVYPDGTIRQLLIPPGETAQGYNRTWGAHATSDRTGKYK